MESYKNKYLKYKSKYLKLKKQLGGDIQHGGIERSVIFTYSHQSAPSSSRLFANVDVATYFVRYDRRNNKFYIDSIIEMGNGRMSHFPSVSFDIWEDVVRFAQRERAHNSAGVWSYYFELDRNRTQISFDRLVTDGQVFLTHE
jgi:hypothetical protein